MSGASRGWTPGRISGKRVYDIPLRAASVAARETRGGIFFFPLCSGAGYMTQLCSLVSWKPSVFQLSIVLSRRHWLPAI